MRSTTQVRTLILTLSLTAAVPGMAQEVGGEVGLDGAEFVVIDTRRVVAESDIGRGITERVEAAASTWDERVAEARQGLATLTQQRSAQALTLTESALAALDTRINEQSVVVRRLEEDARRELANLGEEVRVQLNAALGPPLQAYARERGFSFVFDSASAAETGLLYWAPEVDATDEFIARLNGAVVDWRDLSDDEGELLGSVRVPEAERLKKMIRR